MRVASSDAGSGVWRLPSGSSSGSAEDGGSIDASVPSDASTTDSGVGDASGPPPPATALFLHASPSLASVRLCWLPGNASLPPFPADNEMPASNYAGIPVGGAAAPTDPALAATLSSTQGTLYAIDAKLLAAENLGQIACGSLVCAAGSECLRENTQYWMVGPIGPFSPGVTVVAIAGCLASVLDPLASTDRCGATWTAVQGNLHADVLPLGALPASSDGGGPLLVQAAQLSPGMQALGGATVSFGPAGASQQLVAQLSNEGDLLPELPSALELPSGLAAFGTLGFAVDAPGTDAGPGHLWMSLAQTLELVNPAVDPAAYYAGGPYLVAVMGDPNAPYAFAANEDGGYSGIGLHVLVLPTAQSSPP